ncbi:hypothetical protein [Rothia nasimurium]|uniref:hypothetical protein n=1 Tax=Rothia nasimurium TaxID=85336 RepID=UPI001F33E41A|nr:hypothetical protein [Rothia nasimurium]
MASSSVSALPIPVKILVGLSLLQALYLVVTALIGTFASADIGGASVIASFYFIIALALAVGAVAVWKAQRFGQPLVLVWQLFAVIIGVQTTLGGDYLVGLATVGISGAVILLLFTRPTLEHLAPSSR